MNERPGLNTNVKVHRNEFSGLKNSGPTSTTPQKGVPVKSTVLNTPSHNQIINGLQTISAEGLDNDVKELIN